MKKQVRSLHYMYFIVPHSLLLSDIYCLAQKEDNANTKI